MAAFRVKMNLQYFRNLVILLATPRLRHIIRAFSAAMTLLAARLVGLESGARMVS